MDPNVALSMKRSQSQMQTTSEGVRHGNDRETRLFQKCCKLKLAASHALGAAQPSCQRDVLSQLAGQ